MKYYQHILALIFAIEEINRNPKLLPNITMGFHIYDNLFDSKITYESILDLLFTKKKNTINYNCENKYILSVIGGFTVETSIQMASIFSIYKIPQFAYGESGSELSSKIDFPFLYWMVPKEATLFMGIIRLLLHFKWMWVGLLVSDDDDGENFVQKLTLMLAQNKICIAFLRRDSANKYLLNYLTESTTELLITLHSTNAKVIVLSMNSQLVNILSSFLEEIEFAYKIRLGKIWIMPVQWYFSITSTRELIGRNIFHGSLSFSVQTKPVPGFHDFLLNLNPDETLSHFFCVFWEFVFNVCERCKGEKKLEKLPAYSFEMDMSGESYTIYNTVYAVAYALQAIYSSRQRTIHNKYHFKHSKIQPWQLPAFLNNIHFNNSAGHEILFDYGELSAGLDLLNWITFPNQTYFKIRVGKISPRQEFAMSEDTVIWNTRFKQVPPHSVCVESCQAGQNKIFQEGKPICCFECIPCSKDMISDQMDALHCVKCPEDQYPNSRQDQCIPKIVTFLSYHEPIGIALVSFALSFAFISVLVISIFIKNWNTTIVKANNRNLTCILLTSLLLSYLSSLFFIGKPSKVSCLLQVTAFGIIFSVAVSCVLAKTTLVILAFMATKPGSRAAKWLGQKVANAVVVLCSLVQISLCTVWLLASPPFLDHNLHSQAGEIEIECNEGSITMFSCVLGYLGLLALISFSVAFLARKLPDAFNEAKFITFSMLVFCTVWISFIPGYLSTKGKYVVAMEVFAVLASNTSLLICIFLPKCYIIIFRPDLNTRKILVKKM